MTVFFIALGVLVGTVMVFVLPWALLRKLEANEPDKMGE
jgi:hypothetical protein